MYIWTRRWGDSVQINKEAGLQCIAGSRRQICLWRETVFRPSTIRVEKAILNIFRTHR